MNGADPSGNFGIDEMMVTLAVSITVMAMSSCTTRKKRDIELVWDNKSFDLYEDYPKVNPKKSRTLSSDEIQKVKATALQAFRAALGIFGVDVGEGHYGTNTAVVEDRLPAQSGTPSCGATAQSGASVVSTVSWECNMEQAQWARQSGALDESLLNAIGLGIGNNAAHEVAHQFIVGHNFGMDDNSIGTYNGGEGRGDLNPNTYIGRLVWGETTSNELRRKLSQ